MNKQKLFPLDTLNPANELCRAAGRFGIDVLGLFCPAVEDVTREGVRVFDYRKLSQPMDFAALFQQNASRISLAEMDDHVLAVSPAGRFFSTDEIALSRMHRKDERLTLELDITHIENPNLDPAPRDLFVLVIFSGENPSLRSLMLKFSGRDRDLQGNETPLADTIAPSILIEFME